jgi:hypothetical protein
MLKPRQFIFRRLRRTCIVSPLFVLLLAATAALPADPPLLVLLGETGQSRDGIPVLRLHPDGDRIRDALLRGFSARWLRLYHLEQMYLHKKGGPAPEPAYLLLSSQEGGFPRFGFYLGAEDKRHAAYVDLHRNSDVSGYLGAMDQIFPHELAHVMVQQLAGAPPPGGSNQIHAIGVRTDPVIAFQEGFAESIQIMALDDPETNAASRAAAVDPRAREAALARLRAYQRELTARWAPAPRLRMSFVLWFSATEQSLRYHAVKANAFARAPQLPARLLVPGDPYAAYLLENILPGGAADPPRSAARMFSTEGVVSAFFYRWATSKLLQQKYRDATFYAQFDALRDQVAPLENLYLKLFHVLHARKPQNTIQLIAAYKAEFPDESEAVDAVVREVLLGQPLPSVPPLWLANRDFSTGTSLFDQFRRVPRPHTFDLNTASVVDLLTVPGVDLSKANAIVAGAPYAMLDDLRRVPGFSPALAERFRRMAAEMDSMRASQEDVEARFPLREILLSYVWRAVFFLLATALAGAILFRFIRQVRWYRAALNGLAASLMCLLPGWIAAGPFLAAAAVLLLFGLPAALWQLWRQRSAQQAIRVLLAWLAAVLPAVLVQTPLF